MRQHYCPYDTSFGRGAVVFEKGAAPVKKIYIPEPGLDVEDMLQRAGARHEKPLGAVSALRQDLKAFFKGIPIKPHWELLDFRGLTPLQRKVLKAVAAIPHGETRSYGDIATEIGSPGASRFVGTTLRGNPFPLAIPCHRVIRADGSPGFFQGGAEGTKLKIKLLQLEQK